MKIPEDQRITQVRLPTGETYSIDELLGHAFTRYNATRRTYNLLRRTRQDRPRQVSGPARVNSKYTAEDALWMRHKTAEEIAQQYGITRSQAYYVKNYVKRLYKE